MSKKGKTQPAQTAQEAPDRFLLLQNRHTVHPVHKTEWPQTGGTYIRNPDTGALAKQETTVIPAKLVPAKERHSRESGNPVKHANPQGFPQPNQ